MALVLRSYVTRYDVCVSSHIRAAASCVPNLAVGCKDALQLALEPESLLVSSSITVCKYDL
jgi:hypothetical protein